MKWIGAIRRQAITSANVDPDSCPHMASPDHIEFKWIVMGIVTAWIFYEQFQTQYCSVQITKCVWDQLWE